MPLLSCDLHLPEGAERVLVAMSGGVDSSVAALLAQAQGLEVIGVTLAIPAAAPDEARAVCDRLRIEHRVVDVSEAFEERVVEPFCRAWAAGLTPNPCVVCNPGLKFDELLRIAAEAGCDAIITGHYARVTASGPQHHLLRACDRSKDQSYMLYRSSQHALKSLVLPLGTLTKGEVRALALQAGLPAAARPESQDVCFAPGGDVAALLSRRCPQAVRPGPILDADGSEIGRHDGLARYTVGQRRGLGIGGPEGPHYVLGILPEHNALVVGPEEALWADSCDLVEVRLVGDPPGRSFPASVMTRYRGTETPATVALRGEEATVRFRRPHRAPAPGQSAVFYGGERLIGGGIIRRPT